MPRYFIDTDDGELSVESDVALEFSTDEKARSYALQALADMIEDTLPDGDARSFSVTVRNENRKVIYSAVMTLKGAWQK